MDGGEEDGGVSKDIRPHLRPGVLTPIEFKAICTATIAARLPPSMPVRADQEERTPREE
jgi:hypothetical protein